MASSRTSQAHRSALARDTVQHQHPPATVRYWFTSVTSVTSVTPTRPPHLASREGEGELPGDHGRARRACAREAADPRIRGGWD